MGTSPRQVLRTEEQAIQKLNGLAQTDGCGTATSFSGVMVVNGIIGPAEIAASPSLVAFGNPAYQGLEQSSFSRLGPGLGLGSVAPLPANFGAGSTNGSTWAFQLLAIMLLVALGGFYKFIPVVAARLRHRTHPRGTPFDFESIGLSELELDRAPGGELPSERQREKIAA